MKGAPTYGIYIQYIFSTYFVAIYCHFYERGLPQIGCHSSEMFLSHESWQIWHKHRKLGSSWGLKLLSLECFSILFSVVFTQYGSRVRMKTETCLTTIRKILFHFNMWNHPIWGLLGWGQECHKWWGSGGQWRRKK